MIAWLGTRFRMYARFRRFQTDFSTAREALVTGIIFQNLRILRFDNGVISCFNLTVFKKFG